eukprot:2456614-Rhodomonas_salina.2
MRCVVGGGGVLRGSVAARKMTEPLSVCRAVQRRASCAQCTPRPTNCACFVCVHRVLSSGEHHWEVADGDGVLAPSCGKPFAGTIDDNGSTSGRGYDWSTM